MGGARSSRDGEDFSTQHDGFDDLLRSIARAPAHKPPPDPPEGTRWGTTGRYVVERRLGRGGMGTVYAATDTLLGRTVALKVLDSDDTEEDTKYRTRLMREARLAAQLENERIARVYDVGEHEGNAFVAMEYIRGVTLREWMATPRTAAEIVSVVTQIAEGLAALHASGVVHRDLKPENVMLAATGGLKLVDFGLAGHVEVTEEAGAAPVAARVEGKSASAFLGTPGYMAPEQYAGKRVDARADVFALGIVVCELVTGERPFKGATMPALLRATGEPVAQLEAEAWRRFPEALAKAVRRMLAPAPEARFADGAEVVRALREAGPVEPQAVPDVLQARRRGARRLAVGGLVAVAVVAAAVEATPRVSREVARRHARGTTPPVGMALVDEGVITVGQPASVVEKQCAELGARCRRNVLSYQIPAAKVTVAPYYLDAREVTNQELVDVLNGAKASLHVESDEDSRLPRYVRLDTGLAPTASFLVDLEPAFSGIEFVDGTFYRARPTREGWPANQVTWFGAQFYCKAQGKRLPTENEWEAAARGSSDRTFPWGADSPRCGEVLIPSDGYLTLPGCAETASLADVASFHQDVTPQGIHDMAGSVAEWVDSVYSAQGRDFFGTPTPDAPMVFRGGSFFYSYMALTSVRNKRPANTAHIDVGFRCAADVR